MEKTNDCTNGAQPIKTVKQLQDYLGINRGTFQRYVRLASLYEPVQEMVMDNKLTLSDASRHIASLSQAEQMLFHYFYKDEDKVTHQMVKLFCNIVIPFIREEQQKNQ